MVVFNLDNFFSSLVLTTKTKRAYIYHQDECGYIICICFYALYALVTLN